MVECIRSEPSRGRVEEVRLETSALLQVTNFSGLGFGALQMHIVNITCRRTT